MANVAFAHTGTISYVRAIRADGSLDYCENVKDAQVFASPAAVTSALAGKIGTVDVHGGTGKRQITV